LSPNYKIGFDTPENIDDYFEEVSDDSYLDEMGIVQYVYLCVTKDGYRSNPSPISNSFNFQYFKIDEGEDGRWIDKILLNNLRIPTNISNELKESLESFEIYRKVSRFTATFEIPIFELIATIKIVNKEGPNTYLDTVTKPLIPIALDYNNDTAPISSDICEISNIVVISNIKEKLKFPYDFTYLTDVLPEPIRFLVSWICSRTLHP